MSRRLPFLLTLLSLAGLGKPPLAPGAPAEDELPLNTHRLSDRVLVAWVGNHVQTIDVVALKTARGLVVVETNLIRTADQRIRRAIETAFGRRDFKYLINTHYHHDHTCGNQVYADATVVGHVTVPEGMKSELTGEGLVRLVDKFKAMAKDWGDGLAQAEPGSRDHQHLREGVVLFKTAVDELQSGFTPTPPTLLFDRSLVLDLGDVTLELYAVGGMHTPSDIMVFVPEEGLVAVGDVTPDRMLPYLRKGAGWDLDLILESWGKVVAGGRDIKYVNMAHSHMDLSVATFKQQYGYLKRLWEGLGELRRQGASLETARNRYSIERDFPYFKDRTLVVRGTNIHENNVEAIWEKLKATNSS